MTGQAFAGAAAPQILLAVKEGRVERAALREAVLLASSWSASVEVMMVVPPGEALPGKRPVTRLLSPYLRALRRSSVPVTAYIEQHKSADLAIATRALAMHASLVIVQAQGQRLRERLRTERPRTALIRRCPSPLLIVRPSRSSSDRRAPVLVSFGRRSSPWSAVKNARTLMLYANRFAAGLTTTLCSVHVYPDQTELNRQTTAGPSRVRFASPRTAIYLRTVRRRFEKWNRQAMIAPERSNLLQGDPTRKIPECARKLRVQLLVIGMSARSPRRGSALRSLPEHLLRACSCDLLLIPRSRPKSQ